MALGAVVLVTPPLSTLMLSARLIALRNLYSGNSGTFTGIVIDGTLDLVPGCLVLVLALQPGSLLYELLRQYPLNTSLLGFSHPEMLHC